ncbi:glycosyltransferase [Paracoccaceae bacterium]|nr:glycosyltransferase [Paracoccaceae bacterium]
MKVALIHDWLVDFGGAEVVLQNLVEIYPDADLFTAIDFLGKDERSFLKKTNITTSWLQKIPFVSKFYRYLMPLMFRVVEDFDLTSYDLIVSSSHAVAKNVIVSPNQLHICYCHSPMRYAWDMAHEYQSKLKLSRFSIKGYFIKRELAKARYMDLASSFRVDYFIANSSYIRKRIMKCYKRDSIVIHPPCPQLVSSQFLEEQNSLRDYFFTCSRLVSYKNVDLIATTFGECHPDLKIKIAGDGPDRRIIEKLSEKYRNVEYLGRVSDEEKTTLMLGAKAFVYAAKEDFGIVPVEAQSCGTPVVAFGEGGLVDTIMTSSTTHPTGVLYGSQTMASLSEGISRFLNEYDLSWRENAQKNSQRFSKESFKKELSNFVNDLVREERI